MSVIGDWIYLWASGPMAEVSDDPMHQADMTIVELAHVTGITEETQAAIDRIRARGVWCYEEGGRRYAAARRLWAAQQPAWEHTDWWRG